MNRNGFIRGSLGILACAGLLKLGATPTQVGLLAVPLSLLTTVIALLVDRFAPRRAPLPTEAGMVGR